HRRAGKFELSTRLQRDRAAAGDIEQADHLVAFDDRLPAQQQLHAFKQSADAMRSLIGHGTMALDREGGFFVLGADTKISRRFYTGLEPRDQFIARFQGCHIGLVTRHGLSGSETPQECARVSYGASDRSRPRAKGRRIFGSSCGRDVPYDLDLSPIASAAELVK